MVNPQIVKPTKDSLFAIPGLSAGIWAGRNFKRSNLRLYLNYCILGLRDDRAGISYQKQFFEFPLRYNFNPFQSNGFALEFGVNPQLFLAQNINFTSQNPSTQSHTNTTFFNLSPGLGVSFKTEQSIDFFFRYEYSALGTYNNRYIDGKPHQWSAGINFDLNAFMHSDKMKNKEKATAERKRRLLQNLQGEVVVILANTSMFAPGSGLSEHQKDSQISVVNQLIKDGFDSLFNYNKVRYINPNELQQDLENTDSSSWYLKFGNLFAAEGKSNQYGFYLFDSEMNSLPDEIPNYSVLPYYQLSFNPLVVENYATHRKIFFKAIYSLNEQLNNFKTVVLD